MTTVNESRQKIALVTGASSGIGEAIGRQLAESGYYVFCASRRGTMAGGGSVEGLILDVTNDASVKAGVDTVLKRSGRIDVLVNAAGFGVAGANEESSMAQAHAIFETNFFGILRLTNAVLPAMRAQGFGRVVNISSLLGLFPAPFSGLYCATKHALEAYSESLDQEVSGFGVRVVLIEPGFIKTAIAEAGQSADSPLSVYDGPRARVEQSYLAMVSGAPGPETVANAVLVAISANAPRPRYAVGGSAKLVAALRRFIPRRIIAARLRKVFDIEDEL